MSQAKENFSKIRKDTNGILFRTNSGDVVVNEETISSAYVSIDEDNTPHLYVRLREKIGDRESVRVKGVSLMEIETLLNLDHFVTVTANSEDGSLDEVQQFIVAKAAIQHAKEDEGRLVQINVRDVLLDDIYGEGNGETLFGLYQPTQDLLDCIDTKFTKNTDKYGWRQPRLIA